MSDADLIYECGQLKKFPRSGWLSIGIPKPESIADHSWRTAVIGLILAKMEKADENKVLKLCLFHDLHEARMTDIHCMASKYLQKDGRKAAREMSAKSPHGKEILGASLEFFDCATKEAIIAKDADLLEMLATAREYASSGNAQAELWVKSAKKRLKTDSGKKLALELEKTGPYDSWKADSF